MRNFLTVLNSLVLAAGLTALAPAVWAGSSPSPAGWGGTNAAPAGWGEAHGSYLGIHIEDISPEKASSLKLADTNGALITDIDQDGPACRAGLKENDVIVSFNGSNVANPAELANLIHGTPAGKTVPMVVIRNGQKQDIQVTLGSMNQIVARATAPERPRVAMPAIPYSMAEIEVPSFTPLSARHGIVVESLCPQLSDYFGVPQGQGVLVRTVEKGSPAAMAGLKAGDVIIKVNNDPVHDLADWRRDMRRPANKVSIGIMRDKREQTLEIKIPGAGDNSKLNDFDWEGVNSEELQRDMQAFGQEMEKLAPEIERSQTDMMASMGPSQKDLEKMQRDIEKSMKLKQKDIEKMANEWRKAMPTEKQLSDMQTQIQKSLPTQEQMDAMRHQIEDSMKSWTPQFQQQMQELQKQLEQQQQNWQKMMKDWHPGLNI